MLKTLIIDDEPMVREGLKTIIEWEKYGYCICGEAADGIEGLERIQELYPDLILVDIKMPGIDGIELIRQIKEKCIKVKIIVLSGYSDFMYTKKAIQYGVSSYLLKPIEETELIDIISELYEVINDEKDTSRYIDNGKQFTKTEIIKAIVKGEASESDFAYFIKNKNTEPGSMLYQIALVDRASLQNNDVFDMNLYIQTSTSREMVNNRNIDTFEMNDKIGLVFSGLLTSVNYNILESIQTRIREELKVDLFIAQGRPVTDIRNLHVSYIDAKKILDKRFFYEQSHIFSWDESIASENNKISTAYVNTDFCFYPDRLFVAVQVGDIEKIHSEIEELNMLPRYEDMTEESIKIFCVNLLAELFKRILEENSLSREMVKRNEKAVNCIYRQPSIYHLKEYMLSEILELSNKISNTNSDSLMNRILYYINKNYDKDLSLEMLADIFGYNSSYLGKLFKNHTGECFNTYLEGVRIENAKTLLSKGLKVSDIAQRTGFNNLDYFYYKFKKYVGLSTSEFKKSLKTSE